MYCITVRQMAVATSNCEQTNFDVWKQCVKRDVWTSGHGERDLWMRVCRASSWDLECLPDLFKRGVKLNAIVGCRSFRCLSAVVVVSVSLLHLQKPLPTLSDRETVGLSTEEVAQIYVGNAIITRAFWEKKCTYKRLFLKKHIDIGLNCFRWTCLSTIKWEAYTEALT